MSKILSIFSSKKCLDSLLLNILGVQPLRYCLSKILYNTKLLIKRNNSFKNFRKYGYDYKENFLENNDFEKIKNEFNEAINNSQLANQTEQIHGVYDHGIKYTTMPINKNIQNLYPNLYKITQNEFIKNYFEKNEQKKNIQIFCRLERIMVKDIDIPDPNKDYHYDTFHNTFKAWLFISDVKEEDGPFSFIPYSHKFSIKRILKEWKYSILFCIKKIDGSFRDQNKNKSQTDSKAIKFIVNKNTFVMANTHSLHRRGDAKKNTVRDSIQFWTRENPFKIFIN